MAIDYKATDALMRDPDFIGRTRIACLHFASYIDGEAEDVPAHNTRIKWAQGVFENPDGAAAAIMPTLVMDPKVQTDGATIADADLQSAVETSVNKMF